MTTSISADAFETPINPWAIANWVATPIEYFYPTLSNYLLNRNEEITTHTAQIIAKKMNMTNRFKIFEGKKIEVIGGSFSYPEAILITPKIIEKHQLFELTKSIHKLNDNHHFHDTCNYIVAALFSFLVFTFAAHHLPFISLGLGATAFVSAIYFSRQSVYIYDEKAAKVVGFQLAKESIAKEKSGPIGFLFSPSIDRRLKYLDQIERQNPNLPAPSLEDFFSKTEITFKD